MWIMLPARITSLCIAAIAVSCGWVTYDGTKSNLLVTESPNKTYKVVLEKGRGTPDVDSTRDDEIVVRFSAAERGTSLVSKELLYSADSLDRPFEILFPNHLWISESALRFGEDLSRSQVRPDEIKVLNETDQRITYLRINSGKYEMFLLFEINPNTNMTLSTQAQTDTVSDLSWISGTGRFEDGKILPEEGKNFYIRGKYSGPAHYAIIIRKEGIIIQSEEFEALKTSR